MNKGTDKCKTTVSEARLPANYVGNYRMSRCESLGLDELPLIPPRDKHLPGSIRADKANTGKKLVSGVAFKATGNKIICETNQRHHKQGKSTKDKEGGHKHHKKRKKTKNENDIKLKKEAETLNQKQPSTDKLNYEEPFPRSVSADKANTGKNLASSVASKASKIICETNQRHDKEGKSTKNKEGGHIHHKKRKKTKKKRDIKLKKEPELPKSNRKQPSTNKLNYEEPFDEDGELSTNKEAKRNELEEKERRKRKKRTVARKSRGKSSTKPVQQEKQTYPQEVPWLLSNERKLVPEQNLLPKGNIDNVVQVKEKTMQKKPTSQQHSKIRGPQLIFLPGEEGESCQSKDMVDRGKNKSDVPAFITINDDEETNFSGITNIGVRPGNVVQVKEKTMQNNPTSQQHSKIRGPQLIFLPDEEEEPCQSKDMVDRGKNKSDVPAFITINDDEEENFPGTTNIGVRPGAFAVNGPNARDASRAQDESQTNNHTMTASAQIVPEVPEAVLVDENEKSRRKRLKRRVTFGVSLILLSVGAIVGWQIMPGNDNPAPTQASTFPPTKNPNSTRELLSSISPSSIPALNNESSPQYQALKWLVADDKNNTGENNTKDELVSSPPYSLAQTIQRWVLAILYYSTAGTEWTVSSPWLSEDHECSWNTSMIRCDGADEHQKDIITTINLTANNLHGTIPLELGLLSDSLVYLNIRSNSLQGSIPTELGSLSRLEWLDLTYNNLVGTIPTELGLLRNIYKILLGQNELTGTIPPEMIGFMDSSRRLHTVELWFNQLTGTIPTKLSESIVYLTLQSNSLTGTIPTEIGLLSNMHALFLGYNQLSGTLPTEVGFLSNLVAMLSIQENPLVGTMPSEIGLLTSTQYMVLHNTAMTPGIFPTEIGNLHSTKMFTIDGNSLIGTIPTQLGLLTDLELCSMNDNYLDGPLPSEIGVLSNTLVGLNVANNQLTGTIPTTFGHLTNLMYLYIHENDLRDPVPEALCNLRDTGILSKFEADCDEIKCPSSCCTYCTYY